jgi:peptidoglycan hydrolase-like protein with peptidoglycan-binding domain
MRRRTWALVATVVLAVAAATGGLVVASSGTEPSSAGQELPANTATVENGELSTMVSLAGTLTYRARSDGSPFSAINRADGIYTELPSEGDKVDCGDVFYRVDEHPVLLLCGAVPAYRDLAIGDQGDDVRQLNRNLHELGYGHDIDSGDSDFTSKTEGALKNLQDDEGLAATGALDLDDAVFLPEPTRIASVTGQLGGSAQPGAEVAQATSDTLEVHVELQASQQGAMKEGDRAQITLPDNRSMTGRIARVGRVARAPSGPNAGAEEATIPAYVSLDDPEKARGLDEAPVQVDISTTGVKSALSVPVTAIVGKSGGGFAVEVVRDDGQRELVAVELGLFDTAAGRVEVEGDLAAGDRVVVPSL